MNAIYLNDAENDTLRSFPGFSTFSLQSNIDKKQNNVSQSADYILKVDGRILYKGNPPETTQPLFNPPEFPEPDNIYWLIDEMTSLKDSFMEGNFYEVWIGEADVKKIFLGSGCNLQSLTFSDNTNNAWNQTIDYSAEILIPVTGGGTLPGPTKVLSTTEKGYISSLDENISISKKDLYSFDYDQRLSEGGDQYGGPEYIIRRTITAIAKTPKDTGSLYYAKNAAIDLYDNSATWENLADGLSIANISVSQSIDEIAGSFSLTSEIIAFTGAEWAENKPYINKYDITRTYSQDLKKSITINGTMKATQFESSTDIGSYLPQREDESLLTNLAFEHKNFENDRFEVIKDLYYNEVGSKLYALAIANAHNNSFAEDHPITNNEGYITLLERNGNTILNNWSGALQEGDASKGYYLNPIPINYEVTLNQPEQSIDYSITFDNRTLPLVSGSFQESIEYEDSYSMNSYATHEVFHAPPVMQDLNTYTYNTRTVTYSANFARRHIDLIKMELTKEKFDEVESIVNCFDPSWINSQQEENEQFLTKFEQTLDRRGKYTMKKSWEW